MCCPSEPFHEEPSRVSLWFPEAPDCCSRYEEARQGTQRALAQAEVEPLPHSSLPSRECVARQVTLPAFVSANFERRCVAADTVFAFMRAGIPVHKLDHPLTRAWMAKYSSVAGCIPKHDSTFPSDGCNRVLHGHSGAVRPKVTNNRLSVFVDEWTDKRGVPVVAIGWPEKAMCEDYYHGYSKQIL